MNNEDGEISVGSRVPFPVSTFGLGGGGRAGRGRADPRLRGRVQLLPQRAAREGRAGAEAHAARQRARHGPAGGRREDLRAGAGPEQPRPVDVGADREDDRRREGSADHPDRRPDVRQGDQHRHQGAAAGRHPDPGLLLPQLDEEGGEDQPHHRAHALRHQRHVRSAARAGEEDEGAARVRRALRRPGAADPRRTSRIARRSACWRRSTASRARSSPRRRSWSDLRQRQLQDESGPVELPVGPSSGGPPPAAAPAPAPAAPPPPAPHP